jgi:hypothetical protein
MTAATNYVPYATMQQLVFSSLVGASDARHGNFKRRYDHCAWRYMNEAEPEAVFSDTLWRHESRSPGLTHEVVWPLWLSLGQTMWESRLLSSLVALISRAERTGDCGEYSFDVAPGRALSDFLLMWRWCVE